MNHGIDVKHFVTFGTYSLGLIKIEPVVQEEFENKHYDQHSMVLK